MKIPQSMSLRNRISNHTLFRWMTLLALFLLWSGMSITSAQEATPEITPPLAQPTTTPIPQPLPSSAITQERATYETYFDTLPQGGVGLVHVFGEGMAGGRLRFLNELIDFFPVENDGYYAVLSVSMEQNPRQYDLDIFVWYDDETRQTINTQVEIVTGNFIRQDVTLAPDKAFLADPEIERNELARMEGVFSTITLEKMWDNTGFQLPIPGGELTSPFGAFRSFNQTLQTRHTGWDIRATLGQPVMASADGTVAFTGLMQIRGNVVIIDHGYGIFSVYCHFSQTHVTRGQSITKGQVIGTVGDTGRTSGAHFHWEMAINGAYTDASAFIKMWIP